LPIGILFRCMLCLYSFGVGIDYFPSVTIYLTLFIRHFFPYSTDFLLAIANVYLLPFYPLTFAQTSQYGPYLLTPPNPSYLWSILQVLVQQQSICELHE